MIPIKEWALLKAAKHGAIRVVKYLLPKFADNPNILIEALHVAVDSHQPDVVRLLLGAGTPVNGVSQQGYVALHFAASRANVVMIEILLNTGADINFVTPRGDTPLHHVAGNLRESVTPRRLKRAGRVLIRRGAAQNIQNKLGNTPLHDAIYCTNKVVSVRHYDIMDMLLNSRADLSVRNNYGHTPLGWAILNNCENMIQSLQQAEKRAGIITESDEDSEIQPPEVMADQLPPHAS